MDGWLTTKKPGRDDAQIRRDVEKEKKRRKEQKNSLSRFNCDPAKKKRGKTLDDFIVDDDDDEDEAAWVTSPQSQSQSQLETIDLCDSDSEELTSPECSKWKGKWGGGKKKKKKRGGLKEGGNGSGPTSALEALSSHSPMDSDRSPYFKKKKAGKDAKSKSRKRTICESSEEEEEEEEEEEAEVESTRSSDVSDDDSSSSEEEAHEEDEANSVLRSVKGLVKEIMGKVGEWSAGEPEEAGKKSAPLRDNGALNLSCCVPPPSSSDWITSSELSSLCNVTLAPYQVAGVNWMAMLSRLKLRGKPVNGILGDEMGLGKTVQTICFLRWFKENGGGVLEKENLLPSSSDREGGSASSSQVTEPHLIVVPASTLDNWLREFNRFAPDFEVCKYHGSMNERKELRIRLNRMLKSGGSSLGEDKFPDIVLTTFSYFSGEKSDDRSFLKKFNFCYLVVDEGHTLKNPQGQRYRNLQKFNSRRRLLLTGTPVQNNPQELMALLCFLMPLFSRRQRKSYEEEKDDGGARMLDHFVDRTCAKEGTTEAKAYKKLKNLLAPFILRRKKDQVLGQVIPPKTEVLKEVELTEDGRKSYEGILMAHAKGNGLPPREQRSVFTSLRKACNNPILLRSRWKDPESVKVLTKWTRNAGYFGTDSTLTDSHIRAELENFSDFDIHSMCLTILDDHPSLHEHLGRFTLLHSDLFKSSKCRLLREMLPKLIVEGHRILLFSQWTTNLVS